MTSNSVAGLAALAEQRGGRAHREREQQVGARRVAEEELGHRDREVVLADAHHLLRVALGVPGQVLLQVHGGLGLAGGAAGEEPDRRDRRGGCPRSCRRSQALRADLVEGEVRPGVARPRPGGAGGGTSRAAGSMRSRVDSSTTATLRPRVLEVVGEVLRRAAAGSPWRSPRPPWPRRTRRRRTPAGRAGRAARGPRRPTPRRAQRVAEAVGLRLHLARRCRPRRASRGSACPPRPSSRLRSRKYHAMLKRSGNSMGAVMSARPPRPSRR